MLPLSARLMLRCCEILGKLAADGNADSGDGASPMAVASKLVAIVELATPKRTLKVGVGPRCWNLASRLDTDMEARAFGPLGFLTPIRAGAALKKKAPANGARRRRLSVHPSEGCERV